MLREVFLNYILDGQKEMQRLMNKSIASMLHKYGNSHTVKNFKGRTAYTERHGSDNSYGEKGENTPSGKRPSDVFDLNESKGIEMKVGKKISKKNTSINIYLENLDNEPSEPKLAPIYVTEENKKEEVYSDLLQRLMVFVHNIRGHTGVWREHLQLLKGLLDTVHLFYMPEIHAYLVPMLFDFVLTGNNETKEVSCHILAKILKWQHH